MSKTKTIVVLLSGDDVAYLGSAIEVGGGQVLPAPITRWGRHEWDAMAFSRDRLAIVGDGLVGSDRRNVTAEIPEIREAMAQYAGDDEIDETLTALAAF